MAPARHKLTPPSSSARYSAPITISFDSPESSIRHQEGILREKTKFFNIVRPRTAEEKAAIAQAWAAPALGSAAAPLDIDDLPIKQEASKKKKNAHPKQIHRVVNAEGKAIVADYHIDGKYCTLSAMEVFTRGLDGITPTVETVAQESNCLRAYLIADYLKCLPVQEAIIEAIHFYYAKNDVQFARIDWFNKYKTNDTSDKMMLFLIQQVARVYARVGEKPFKLSNIGYNRFMLTGPRHICKEITDAIGKHAEAVEME